MSGPDDVAARAAAQRKQERLMGVLSAAPGVASGEFVKLTPEQEKARKRRNLMLALSVAAFIVLVFVITVSKIRETGVV